MRKLINEPFYLKSYIIIIISCSGNHSYNKSTDDDNNNNSNNNNNGNNNNNSNYKQKRLSWEGWSSPVRHHHCSCLSVCLSVLR